MKSRKGFNSVVVPLVYLIAFLLVASSTRSIIAEEATGYTISGRVTDTAGDPVPNVTIRANACDLTRQPVLLVHGWGGQDSLAEDKMGFDQLYQWMQADGYVEGCNLFYATGVYATNYRETNRWAIRNNLRQAYRQLVVANPNWRGHFDIIGHSYGGLNARFYLESDYYKEDQQYEQFGIHVDNLFTLGSPHGGVMPQELYPAAWVIAGGNIVPPENLADFLAASDLYAPVMWTYNHSHVQPKDVCYRLIGGDFLQQDDVPWYWRAIYAPWELFDSGDIGVSLRSSRQLGIDPVLSSRYPRVSYVTNEDMHGYRTDWGLGGLRSYVRPSSTYTESILPYLGAPPSQCGFGTQTEQVAVSDSESPFVPPILLSSDVLTAGQTVSDTFVVDWEGQSAFYITWQGGDADLTMVDGQGTPITPAVAQSDPNIGYDEASGAGGGLATYVFTQTVTGSWSYSVTAVGEPYLITCTLYANADTVLVAEASAPEWQPFGAPVVLTTTVMAAGMPVAGATVTATVRQPDGTPVVLPLNDDGQEPDTAAGDGVYVGRCEATAQGGPYSVWVEAAGSSGGHDYRRTTQTFFSVAPEKAALRHTYADEPVDMAGNGSYDYLNVQAGVSVTETGTLALSAVLTGSGGENIDLATVVAEITATGIHTLTLQFDGESIRESALDGPYTVGEVTLLDDDTLIQLDQDDTGLVTAPYNHSDFGSGFAVCLPLVLREQASAVHLDGLGIGKTSPQAVATYQTTTDSQGNYSLIGLPEGTYTIVASQTEYTFTPVSRLIKVPPDVNSDIIVYQKRRLKSVPPS